MSRWFGSVRRDLSGRSRAGEDLLRSLALIIQPEALRSSIAERVRELTGCDSVIVCTLNAEASDYCAVTTTAAEHELPDVAIAATGTLSRWLKTNQEPFVIPHPRGAFDYLSPAEQELLLSHGVRGCIPVFSSMRLVAILLICSRRDDWRLSDDDLQLLVRLGRQAGLALENSELHQLERERLKNLHRAEQLAVAGQLAATLAHEIRNPMTAIRSTVQFALESTTNWEVKRRLLAESIEEIDRIERTLSGVLALSRTSGGDVADVDLVANVEQSLLVVQAYAQAHGVAIDRQFEVNSLPVRGDARGLHQVWVNLFMNACQAMPSGGHLTLRCGIRQPSSETQPMAFLQVRDTGCGISQEHLPQVFSPFFTTKQSGTGLGLPICLDIVARHGGNLRVESAEGRGTSATVLLPLRSG